MVINGQSLSFTRAKRPDDYFYQNMKVTDTDRYKRIAYSWAILVMELILSFFTLMFIQEWENKLKN